MDNQDKNDMKPSEKLKKLHFKMAKIFFFDTIKIYRKEGKSPSDAVEMLNKQVQMCQTLLFCFMVDTRNENAIANIYADMQKMSLETLNMVTENPEILLGFSKADQREPTQTVLDIVKLFKDIRASQNN